MMKMTMIMIFKFRLGETLRKAYKEQPILFYSLMSQSGSTTFCQNIMLLFYDLSLFFQIQPKFLIKLSYLME